MIHRYLIVLLLAFFMMSCDSNKSNLPVLQIYTYSSFQSHYGAGPKLVKEFEKTCQCKVELVNAGDAGLILQRLKVEKSNHVDLVIGLDQLSQVEAEASLTWKPVKHKKVKWHKDLPKLSADKFIPYDWAPMTFVYQKGQVEPAKNFDDLLDARFKSQLSIQDPRLSTPGLQLLMWILDQFGEDEGLTYFHKLTKSIYKLSPSWTSAYGLFQNKKAKVVFSYLTSPVYHWKEKNDESVQPMVFEEGHPAQIEMMAIPGQSDQEELALQFIHLMLSKKGQTILMNTNFMLPVIDGVTEGTLFEKLPNVKIRPMDEVLKKLKHKKRIIAKWYKSIGG